MSGANYDHFTFQVQDDGGTGGDGIDLDPTPNTLTFDLVASAATTDSFGSVIDLATLSATNWVQDPGPVALAGAAVDGGRR